VGERTVSVNEEDRLFCSSGKVIFPLRGRDLVFQDGTRSCHPEGCSTARRISFWNPDFPKGKILPLRGRSAIAFARDDSVRSPSGDGRSGVILRSGFGDEGSGLDSEGLKTRSFAFVQDDNQPETGAMTLSF
jgi:hypothetical protein